MEGIRLLEVGNENLLLLKRAFEWIDNGERLGLRLKARVCLKQNTLFPFFSTFWCNSHGTKKYSK